ncbi:spore germination protein [Effusibacillus lacus]|uniref:Spore germination protein n=1 Tax=Effusibacillus lacus TaxID=1348429 RepID=A0A292YJX8_9BACL|nr:spore germination protein [Effusibacillus lacus]TCS72290.1 spore germination protein GerPA/GerPF [Effusibacillus lacus]GAX90238.1 spore germination protein [Effusibacillus lacus]
MPAVIGGIEIKNLAVAGQFHVGDLLSVAPKDSTLTYGGSGLALTGDFARSFNLLSSTNTIDPDLLDASTDTVL